VLKRSERYSISPKRWPSDKHSQYRKDSENGLKPGEDRAKEKVIPGDPDIHLSWYPRNSGSSVLIKNILYGDLDKSSSCSISPAPTERFTLFPRNTDFLSGHNSCQVANGSSVILVIACNMDMSSSSGSVVSEKCTLPNDSPSIVPATVRKAGFICIRV